MCEEFNEIEYVYDVLFFIQRKNRLLKIWKLIIDDIKRAHSGRSGGHGQRKNLADPQSTFANEIRLMQGHIFFISYFGPSNLIRRHISVAFTFL